MVSVFISYKHKSPDENFAERLHNDLERHGIIVWRDTKIQPGQFWDEEIEKALIDDRTTHLLVLVSESAMQSEIVRDEIEFARVRGKLIIGLVVDNYAYRIRPLLRRQEIDLRDDYELGFQRLLSALKSQKEETKDQIVKPIVDRPDFVLTKAQLRAARDINQLVRVVAAPGTGKSLVIEERVRWLLSRGIEPSKIAVVSFTRAASYDLEKRIKDYCMRNKQDGASSVSVTTLHSLAMKALRKANLLYYPSNPKVLDSWETKNIFDAEFSSTKRDTSQPELQDLNPTRAGEVREAVEAFWNTGQWEPPSYIPPKKAVTQVEKDAFEAFNPPTTQTYSCVLPGEIVKFCVENIEAGTLHPRNLLGIEYFIVDEYQDLNFTDQKFIKSFILSIYPRNQLGIEKAGETR